MELTLLEIVLGAEAALFEHVEAIWFIATRVEDSACRVFFTFEEGGCLVPEVFVLGTDVPECL